MFIIFWKFSHHSTSTERRVLALKTFFLLIAAAFLSKEFSSFFALSYIGAFWRRIKFWKTRILHRKSRLPDGPRWGILSTKLWIMPSFTLLLNSLGWKLKILWPENIQSSLFTLNWIRVVDTWWIGRGTDGLLIRMRKFDFVAQSMVCWGTFGEPWMKSAMTRPEN